MTFKQLIPLCLFFCFAGQVSADVQRLRPVRDPVGFCWQAGEMDQLVSFLEAREPLTTHPGNLGPLVGGILPHDDYLYAAPITYALTRRIEASEALIIGVTHGSVRKILNNLQGVLILDNYSHWPGPYGPVPVSPLRERMKSGLAVESWIENDKAHDLEHSIEALIPLLQYRQRQLTITPIMVTAMPEARMAALSKDLAGVVSTYLRETGKVMGRDFVVLISADGNHYGKDFDNLDFGMGRAAHQAALAYDHTILDELTSGPLNGKRIAILSQELWGADYQSRGKVLWCGKYSIPFGLHLLLELSRCIDANRVITPRLLGYGDTFSQGVLPFQGSDLGITAPFSLEHWVSFFSVAFFADKLPARVH